MTTAQQARTRAAWANVEDDVWAQRVDDIDITVIYLEADSTIEFAFMVN